MSISVQDFINKYNGSPIKSPHGIAGQCVSVPSQFAVGNGWPELFGPGDDTAYHIWQNGIPGYDKIGNVTGPGGNAPVTGDFVFFGPTYGGGAGHTGLVQSANLNSVSLFEQNDPYGSGAHLKTYGYTDLKGWFHSQQNNQPLSTFTVTHVVNVRMGPGVTYPIALDINGKYLQLVPGRVQVRGVVTGGTGTVGTKTSNQWGITLNGHYFSMAATA